MSPVVAEKTMGKKVVEAFVQPKFLFWDVSPLTRRRIDLFKANKRGFYSLLFFSVIFVLSWFAEVVANDKPLYINIDGQHYFPVFRQYSEKEFGGVFPTEPDYLQAYFAVLMEEQDAKMLWPPVRFHHSTNDLNLPADVAAPAPPSRAHWFGTDDSARDVVARLLYGIRESIVFALLLTALTGIIGISLGAVQGFYGGWLDLIMQRVIEIWSSLPFLYIIIIVASIVEPTLVMLVLLLLLFRWMGLAQPVRAEFLRVRNFEYVKAARALGVKDRYLIFRHSLPNAMIATLTYLPFIMSGAVVTLTALDFLGFGLKAGEYARLGELLNQGKNNTNAPWLTFSSFFSIAIMLMLLVFVGEAVRDALDPRKTLG